MEITGSIQWLDWEGNEIQTSGSYTIPGIYKKILNAYNNGSMTLICNYAYGGVIRTPLPVRVAPDTVEGRMVGYVITASQFRVTEDDLVTI